MPLDSSTVLPANVTQWNHCPQCGDSRIEGGSIEIDGVYAIQRVWCGSCELSWTERSVAEQRHDFESP